MSHNPIAPSGQDQIAAAKQRFPNLCATGILPRHKAGPPIDPDHIARALAFLGRCRRTTRPNTHTTDLQRRIGVGPGAIIAAAIGLGFDVRGWYGVTAFYPHALVAVSRRARP
jgi:hypothetical protein